VTGSFGTRPVRTFVPRQAGVDDRAFLALADVDRTSRLIDAVTDVVRPGDRVLELGTGTGILALAAARAGAEAVDAYEVSTTTAAMARRNVAANGYSTVVQVVEEDVTACTFSGPYDVVVAEMCSVGLVENTLVPALNNLFSQGVLGPDVRIVPASQSTFIELVELDQEFFGFQLPMPQVEHSWLDRRVRDTMTELRLVAHPDFQTAARESVPVDDRVLAMIDIRVLHSGRVNAVRMTSMSHLAPGIDAGWSPAMNSPVVIPVDERDLVIGTDVGLDLSYRMGGGFSTLRFEWSDEPQLT
jgi:predicted RNA methylase